MRWFGMHACPEVILAMILVPWIMQRMMITGRKICMVPSKFTLNLLGFCNRGGPPLTLFLLPRIPLPPFLAYVRASRDFCVSRGPPTVPLTRILCNAVFFKSQNLRKAGTLCMFVFQVLILKCVPVICRCLDIHQYLLDHKNSKKQNSFQGIVPLETKRKKLIGWLKEEKSGGTVDCTANPNPVRLTQNSL